MTGQDGALLAEFLLGKGYEVHGMVRRSSTENFERLTPVLGRIALHQGDLLDQFSLIAVLKESRPQEVYNLAAQSFVPASWQQPLLTGKVAALGVARILEAVRLVDPTIRFYQASSSEMFGKAREEPQDEQTTFLPRSPYGAAKAYGHWLTVNYRESYGLFACAGDSFQPRVAAARKGIRQPQDHRRRRSHQARLAGQARLGMSRRDARLGFAGDYVEAMWRMLQQDQPDDFVVASGEKHSVRELAELAFARAGLNWEEHVEVDAKFFRPAEIYSLRGDARKAGRVLGWKPKLSFADLINMMVDADLARVEREAGER